MSAEGRIWCVYLMPVAAGIAALFFNGCFMFVTKTALSKF
jgi:hypothetical protein